MKENRLNVLCWHTVLLVWRWLAELVYTPHSGMVCDGTVVRQVGKVP